jgi:hypothetical protein
MSKYLQEKAFFPGVRNQYRRPFNNTATLLKGSSLIRLKGNSLKNSKAFYYLPEYLTIISLFLVDFTRRQASTILR